MKVAARCSRSSASRAGCSPPDRRGAESSLMPARAGGAAARPSCGRAAALTAAGGVAVHGRRRLKPRVACGPRGQGAVVRPKRRRPRAERSGRGRDPEEAHDARPNPPRSDPALRWQACRSAAAPGIAGRRPPRRSRRPRRLRRPPPRRPPSPPPSLRADRRLPGRGAERRRRSRLRARRSGRRRRGGRRRRAPETGGPRGRPERCGSERPGGGLRGREATSPPARSGTRRGASS